MWKACSRCGKIHDLKHKCTVGKIYKETEERKLRNKYVWALKSQEIREKANYLCEVCRDQGVYTYDPLEVHHIVKVKDAPELFLDDSNLICLCVEHHKKADSGQAVLSQDYLRMLAARRENADSFVQEKVEM